MPEAKTKVPAYRVEYAPTRWAKCHAPPCEGPRIRVGDLRIGYTVGHGDTVRFVWRHWRCVVPEFIRRVQTVVNATSELDGYSEINSEDRKRLDMAWESSQITEPDVQGNAIDKMTKGEKEKRKVRGRRIYKKSRATIVDSSSGDDDKPLGPMNGDGETTSGDDDEPLESPRSMYPTKKADATKEEEEGDEEEPIRERKTKDSDEQTPKPAPTFEKRVPYTLKALFSPPRRRTMKGKGRARTASRSSESSQDTSDSSSEEDSTDTDDDVESTGASQEGTWQNNSVERDARDKARAPQMKVGEEQKGKDKEPLRQMKRTTTSRCWLGREASAL
ncbi:hypothetical protein FPV67DRAFT_211087 [Lyophyllum atratum]|nr:hypothetical protein FPV67DRAFT_211087 [Lyophyllum atratum]